MVSVRDAVGLVDDDVYVTCGCRVLKLDASLERNEGGSNCTVALPLSSSRTVHGRSQQKLVLEEVRTKLEAVSDEVCVVQALVSEPTEPSTTPPQVDLLGIVPLITATLSEDTTMESGSDEEWRTFRRSSGIWDRRRVGVITREKIC